MQIPNAPYPGIYRILCLKNGKFYIGMADNIQTRVKNHIMFLKGQYSHENRFLQKDWNRYGKKNFFCDVIAKVKDPHERLTREKALIRSIFPEFLYNVTCVPHNYMKAKEARRF